MRRLPGLLRLEAYGGSLVRNRDDSRHRDAGTPRRSLRREYFSHVDKPPPSANRCRACRHPLILRPCVALRPDGEFWLRDRLFEDGIVEYVDRSSRSSSAIILLTLFAWLREPRVARRARPRGTRGRRRSANCGSAAIDDAMMLELQADVSRAASIARAARGVGVRRRAPAVSWPCPPTQGGCPDGPCCGRAP